MPDSLGDQKTSDWTNLWIVLNLVSAFLSKTSYFSSFIGVSIIFIVIIKGMSSLCSTMVL